MIDFLEKIIPAVEKNMLLKELADLKEHAIHFSSAPFEIFISKLAPNSALMQEIGRTREITFRAAGEGTGKSVDIDLYDERYYHLILFDTENASIVGGYRLGHGREIYDEYGIDGFYLKGFFDMSAEFEKLYPRTMEMGRSYILPEYQRHRMPLFLLWKGLVLFLKNNPGLRYMLGTVSISKEFKEETRQFIVHYLEKYFLNGMLSKEVVCHTPFQKKDSEKYTTIVNNLDGSIDTLEDSVDELEEKQRRIPVLVKRYLMQNAKAVAFNIDEDFQDVLDILMILDVKQMPASTIETLDRL